MNQSSRYISLAALLIAVGLLLTVIGCEGKSNGSVASSTGKVSHEEHEGEGEESEHQEEVHLSTEALKEAGIVVEELAPRLLGSTIELPGTLRPHPEGEGFVGSLIEGRIKEAFADIGDRVAEGAPLGVIESPTVGEAEAAFITAEADLQFVKADLERHKTLVAEGIGSKKEQLELEARLASSASAVSAAERTLHAYGFDEEDIKSLQTNQHTGGRVTLRSPISGTIVSREARIGMRVTPETDLFHVVDMKRLRVQLDIPEQRIGEIAVGREISVISQNGHRNELKGRIDRIGGSIEHETRTVTALATIDNSSAS